MKRRDFLAATATSMAAAPFSGFACEARAAAPQEQKALIAITLDLEMSRNFPRWEDTYWDYEKGNLNEPTKQYTVEACRRVKAAGGVLHCFVVGRVLEQEDVGWLKQIAAAGHPIGNHTYDHVNVLATKPEDIQFRFRRAPWLIEGKSITDVVAENIRLTTAALKERAGIQVQGFRTPGGFPKGLADRADLRQRLLDLGFRWVSSKYPVGAIPQTGVQPGPDFFRKLEQTQQAAQPFRYPDGLVEIPMSPVSDIGAFRTGRWKLEWFLETIDRALDWVIERRAVFDFLSHPSCLYVVDPQFRAIDLICEKVKKAGDKAALVGLDALADRAG